MPTCRDETSEAETAAATRGGEKKRGRCTRNYSDDNATLRMHPKRTDEASEFQKPLLTEIHCGESRSRFFILLFFATFSLSPLPLLPRRTTRPATCVALFSKWKCTYTYIFPVRTYCMLDRVTKWTQAGGNGGTPENGMPFLFRSVLTERIPSRTSDLFSEEIFFFKEKWPFDESDITKRYNICINLVSARDTISDASETKNICLRYSTAIWKIQS